MREALRAPWKHLESAAARSRLVPTRVPTTS